MVDLWVFILIFIPLAILIGIAAAAISFTAWNLIVPLVFLAFGFGIYESIFLSIVVDLFNAFILTIIYGKHKRIDFREGFLYAIPAIIGAALAFFIAQDFVEQNSDLLKGGVGYVIIILGISFIQRGRKELKAERSSQNMGESPIETIQKEPSTPKRIFPPKVALALAIALSAVSGALAGLLGIGSGFNFVLIFLIFIPGYELPKATATGVFIMFLLMLFCSALFYSYVDLTALWIYIVIAVSFSVVGTLIAVKYTLKLSKAKLSFVVGIIMIIAASVASIQSLLLA
jgi:hypothetical protein